jgi:hypothetical protein
MRATPCKSLKKLPGFAGKTNVMIVTGESGTRAACFSPQGYGDTKIARLFRTNYISNFNALAQILGNLLPGGLYPVKGLFGAAPQIARNSGAHPGQSLKPEDAIALLNLCARAWPVFGTDRNEAR